MASKPIPMRQSACVKIKEQFGQNPSIIGTPGYKLPSEVDDYFYVEQIFIGWQMFTN